MFKKLPGIERAMPPGSRTKKTGSQKHFAGKCLNLVAVKASKTATPKTRESWI